MAGQSTQAPLEGIYIVRQPILDASEKPFGYELVYKDSSNRSSGSDQDNRLTAGFLTDAILSIGMDTLTNGRPAFIKFSRDLLMGNAAALLPADTTVIEILNDVSADPEVIEVCQQLKAAGYAMSLDEFSDGCATEALLPHVKYVKARLQETQPDSLTALRQRLPAEVRLIATGVETAGAFEQAKASGCQLFQGYYFCAPVMRKTQAMPAQQLAYLNLFTALNRPSLTLSEVEDLVKKDLSLTYRILRSVNSAAFGAGREITSVRQALVILGLDQIKRWATVWALAGVNGARPSETTSLALIRARCCEILGTTLSGPEAGAEMFLLGLCSLLDAILGQPMEVALKDVHISAQVREALLGQPNVGRTILDSVIAYERGDWDGAARIAASAGISESDLSDAYTNSLPWAGELSQAA